MRRKIRALLSVLWLGILSTPALAGMPPELLLTKTVGIGPGCATTSQVSAMPGDEVTYCYTVGHPNGTGNQPYTIHMLEDSVLGTIVLPPTVLDQGQEAVVTESYIFTGTGPITNLATWTADNPGGEGPFTAIDTATVLPAIPPVPAPAVSSLGYIISGLLLAAMGFFALRRRVA